MGYIRFTITADQEPGSTPSNDRDRTLFIAKVPRVKSLDGFQRRDGAAVFSDASQAFAVIHESFGEYVLRLEGISPNRPKENLIGSSGFVGDAFSELSKVTSSVNQGNPFDLTLDDHRGDQASPDDSRRMETVTAHVLRAGDTGVVHIDRYWDNSISGGTLLDGFGAGDVVYIEDVRDRSRYEINRVASVTDSRNLVLSQGVQFDYESGSIIREAFYFPKCIGTRVTFAQRAGRKSPQAEVWDFELRFVTVRNSVFSQLIPPA